MGEEIPNKQHQPPGQKVLEWCQGAAGLPDDFWWWLEQVKSGCKEAAPLPHNLLLKCKSLMYLFEQLKFAL